MKWANNVVNMRGEAMPPATECGWRRVIEMTSRKIIWVLLYWGT